MTIIVTVVMMSDRNERCGTSDNASSRDQRHDGRAARSWFESFEHPALATQLPTRACVDRPHTAPLAATPVALFA